jgi:hypothetical protein
MFITGCKCYETNIENWYITEYFNGCDLRNKEIIVLFNFKTKQYQYISLLYFEDIKNLEEYIKQEFLNETNN